MRFNAEYNPSYKECLCSLTNGCSVTVGHVGDADFELYESPLEFKEVYPDEREYFQEEMRVTIRNN